MCYIRTVLVYGSGGACSTKENTEGMMMLSGCERS